MERGSGFGLLGPEEVARLVGVKETTVWRWCREGRLPCLKVGKHWRVRRAVLEDFLRESERPRTLVGQLGSFLRVPDNVLVVAEDVDLLRRLDAAFFRVGEARGGLLVKFYGGEEDPEDELRAHLERNGLEVGRLEREGRFLMRPEGDPLGGRGDALRRILEEESEEGRNLWASFDWVSRVDPETALEQQRELSELVEGGRLVAKTAVLEETVDGWPGSVLARAQRGHSATVLASDERLSMSRATPMPPD